MELLPGANAPLPDGPLAVDVAWDDGVALDVSALLLGPHGKVRGDADMVFFNNPRSEAGAVRFTGGERAARVDVDVAAVPHGIERIAIVAAVDVDASPGTTFAAVRGLRAAATAGGTRLALGVPPLDRGETAAILAEVYRRGGAWKVRVVGQGYASGLAGVAADFGVDVAEDDAGYEAGYGAGYEAVPEPASSINLAKGGKATVALDKHNPQTVVTATLEWDGGSAQRRADGADLDLYALFVPAAQVAGAYPASVGRRTTLENLSPAEQAFAAQAELAPERGAVYWNSLGSLHAAPYIALDKDRSAPGTETIRIARPHLQGFVLICAYSALGNGSGSFRSYGARAVVAGGGNAVTAPLYFDNDSSFWVAVALVDFTDPAGVAIHHIEAYGDEWSEGRPVLFPDGGFAMDVGPTEFKDDL